jgi:hypothetical protein
MLTGRSDGRSASGAASPAESGSLASGNGAAAVGPSVPPHGQILAQALAYAATGWPVFPCRPDNPACPAVKEPSAKCDCKAPDCPHGFKDATTDPERVRAWWRTRPDRNLAIATGAPAVDVLDVDVHEAGSGFPAFNRAKRAGLLAGALALVRTPSGGLHAYYAGTSQPSARLTRLHVDFKAAGGYVLAPPSVVHGKPYELLDHRPGTASLDWQAVRQLLDPPRRTAARLPGDGDVTRLAAWVAGQPQGNRNAGLFWASCRINGDAGAAELLVSAAVQAGLPEGEARRTVASAAGRAAR